MKLIYSKIGNDHRSYVKNGTVVSVPSIYVKEARHLEILKDVWLQLGFLPLVWFLAEMLFISILEISSSFKKLSYS